MFFPKLFFCRAALLDRDRKDECLIFSNFLPLAITPVFSRSTRPDWTGHRMVFVPEPSDIARVPASRYWFCFGTVELREISLVRNNRNHPRGFRSQSFPSWPEKLDRRISKLSHWSTAWSFNDDVVESNFCFERNGERSGYSKSNPSSIQNQRSRRNLSFPDAAIQRETDLV